MDVIGVKRNGAKWEVTSPMANLSPADWADEGHFQRKCLDLGVPLYFRGNLCEPICAEFPANPGIDLIYLAPTGELLLVEAKGRIYNAKDLVVQTAGKYYAARSSTVNDLLRYLRNKPVGHDVSAGALARAEAWTAQHGIDPGRPFERLFSEGRIVLAALVPGRPNDQLIQTTIPPVVVYGVEMASSEQLAQVYADARRYLPGSRQDVAANVRKLGEAYLSRVERTTSKSRARKAIGAEEVDRFFTSSRAPSGPAYMYRKLKARGFHMAPGKDENYSVMAQPLDATGQRRTLLRIFGRGSVELPGNLYQQQRQWNVDQATIDRLLRQVTNLFLPSQVNRQAGKNIEIWLNGPGISVNQATLDKMIELLDEFLTTSRQSRRR